MGPSSDQRTVSTCPSFFLYLQRSQIHLQTRSYIIRGGKQDWRAKGICMSSLRVYVTTTRIRSGSGLQKLENKGAYTCTAADVGVTV
jgi:hypothetical protein